jgi:hypothetical protein
MTPTISQPSEKACAINKTAPAAKERPEKLYGKTYKIKTPLAEHALYVTINDLDGRPFEIFINSKSMEHFQWIIGQTRIISLAFRQGSDLATLADEMKSVFAPKGGYFKKGGQYMPSLVAEIGHIIERHCAALGLIERDTSLADAAKAMVAEKTAEKTAERPSES